MPGLEQPRRHYFEMAFSASTMPLPKKLLYPVFPWHVAVGSASPGPCTTVFGVGHGRLLAVCWRIDSTAVGDICGLFLLFGVKSPYWLMISAATPATFGVAIDVPCTQPYG